jgi:heterodisulfide reductase subunit C
VQRSNLDPLLQASLREGFDDLRLWRCQQCGQCSAVCPSYKNGGINPREVMERALTASIDLERDRSIWQCTMCNACSERCQLDVDPARVITALRNLAAEKGNVPAHFLSEARLFVSSGMAFPVTGLTKKLRVELKLEELEVGEDTIDEIRIIASKTRMGRVDIEP